MVFLREYKRLLTEDKIDKVSFRISLCYCYHQLVYPKDSQMQRFYKLLLCLSHLLIKISKAV